MKMRGLILFPLLAALSSQSASCEELSNFTGSDEIVVKSRAASAEALRALEIILNALRLRELQDVNGNEKLLEASRVLRAALGNMKDVVEAGVPDFNFSDDQMSFINFRLKEASARNDNVLTNSKTFLEFVSRYLEMGERLAAALNEAAKPTEGRSALSYFSVQLGDFIVVGDTISILSRPVQ